MISMINDNSLVVLPLIILETAAKLNNQIPNDGESYKILLQTAYTKIFSQKLEMAEKNKKFQGHIEIATNLVGSLDLKKK